MLILMAMLALSLGLSTSEHATFGFFGDLTQKGGAELVFEGSKMQIVSEFLHKKSLSLLPVLTIDPQA